MITIASKYNEPHRRWENVRMCECKNFPNQILQRLLNAEDISQDRDRSKNERMTFDSGDHADLRQ